MGEITTVDRLLRHGGANPNFGLPNFDNLTPLHLAVILGNARIVKLLLKHNAWPDANDTTGWTPLMFAVYRARRMETCQSSVDIIRLLMVHNARSCIKNNDDNNVFHIAAALDQDELIKELFEISETNSVELACCYKTHVLSQDAVIDALRSTDQETDKAAALLATLCDSGFAFFTPLHYAAARGNIATVTLLIDFGAYVDPIDALTWTPLFWAARFGHREVCATLLLHGADYQWKDSRGLSVIDVLCLYEHFELKETLEDIIIHRLRRIFRERSGCVEAKMNGDQQSPPIHCLSTVAEESPVSPPSGIGGVYSGEQTLRGSERSCGSIEAGFCIIEPNTGHSMAVNKSPLSPASAFSASPVTNSELYGPPTYYSFRARISAALHLAITILMVSISALCTATVTLIILDVYHTSNGRSVGPLLLFLAALILPWYIFMLYMAPSTIRIIRLCCAERWVKYRDFENQRSLPIRWLMRTILVITFFFPAISVFLLIEIISVFFYSIAKVAFLWAAWRRLLVRSQRTHLRVKETTEQNIASTTASTPEPAASEFSEGVADPQTWKYYGTNAALATDVDRYHAFIIPPITPSSTMGTDDCELRKVDRSGNCPHNAEVLVAAASNSPVPNSRDARSWRQNNNACISDSNNRADCDSSHCLHLDGDDHTHRIDRPNSVSNATNAITTTGNDRLGIFCSTTSDDEATYSSNQSLINPYYQCKEASLQAARGDYMYKNVVTCAGELPSTIESLGCEEFFSLFPEIRPPKYFTAVLTLCNDELTSDTGEVRGEELFSCQMKLNSFLGIATRSKYGDDFTAATVEASIKSPPYLAHSDILHRTSADAKCHRLPGDVHMASSRISNSGRLIAANVWQRIRGNPTLWKLRNWKKRINGRAEKAHNASLSNEHSPLTTKYDHIMFNWWLDSIHWHFQRLLNKLWTSQNNAVATCVESEAPHKALLTVYDIFSQGPACQSEPRDCNSSNVNVENNTLTGKPICDKGLVAPSVPEEVALPVMETEGRHVGGPVEYPDEVLPKSCEIHSLPSRTSGHNHQLLHQNCPYESKGAAFDESHACLVSSAMYSLSSRVLVSELPHNDNVDRCEGIETFEFGPWADMLSVRSNCEPGATVTNIFSVLCGQNGVCATASKPDDMEQDTHCQSPRQPLWQNALIHCAEAFGSASPSTESDGASAENSAAESCRSYTCADYSSECRASGTPRSPSSRAGSSDVWVDSEDTAVVTDASPSSRATITSPQQHPDTTNEAGTECDAVVISDQRIGKKSVADVNLPPQCQSSAWPISSLGRTVLSLLNAYHKHDIEAVQVQWYRQYTRCLKYRTAARKNDRPLQNTPSEIDGLEVNQTSPWLDYACDFLSFEGSSVVTKKTLGQRLNLPLNLSGIQNSAEVWRPLSVQKDYSASDVNPPNVCSAFHNALFDPQFAPVRLLPPLVIVDEYGTHQTSKTATTVQSTKHRMVEFPDFVIQNSTAPESITDLLSDHMRKQESNVITGFPYLLLLGTRPGRNLIIAVLIGATFSILRIAAGLNFPSAFSMLLVILSGAELVAYILWFLSC